MKKYVYIGVTVIAIIAIVVLLIGIGEDIYFTIKPTGRPTSMYNSHVTAIKFFLIAALSLVVGIIIRLLKV